MATDLMRYDILAQHALRGVVRLALLRVERDGLPGEHHFFISFKTDEEGVEISEKLRKRHPEEMTIVLQHQYWNLKILEDRFEVELSFDNIPEHMTIPFAAIKGFFDPTVQFGLQFESDIEAGDSDETVSGRVGAAKDLHPANSDDAQASEDKGKEKETKKQAGKKPVAKADKKENKDGGTSETEDASKVVSLDSFRKK